MVDVSVDEVFVKVSGRESNLRVTLPKEFADLFGVGLGDYVAFSRDPLDDRCLRCRVVKKKEMFLL